MRRFDGGTRRLLGGLIVTEIAIAAVLLMGSLTLTQYFRKIVHEPWGFETDHRVVFNCDVVGSTLFDSAEARARTIDKTLTELRALPGVRSAAVTAPAPMEAARDLMSCVPEGTQPPEPRGIYLAYMRGAGPGYFSTIGQRLLRGREFAETDQRRCAAGLHRERIVRAPFLARTGSVRQTSQTRPPR